MGVDVQEEEGAAGDVVVPAVWVAVSPCACDSNAWSSDSSCASNVSNSDGDIVLREVGVNGEVEVAIETVEDALGMDEAVEDGVGVMP